jgi:HK97 family phage prohead protease
MTLETKFQSLAGQGGALTLEAGTRIRGYASVFGVRDRGGDVVMPGAYGAALERLTEGGGRIKMLWQHDPAEPIGVWDRIEEDGHGLKVEGHLLNDVARGREAAALLAAGAVDGLSIGYRTLRAEKLPGGGRKLIELELWEVSLVTFPMLPVARVAAKAVPRPSALVGAFLGGMDAAGAALKWQPKATKESLE